MLNLDPWVNQNENMTTKTINKFENHLLSIRAERQNMIHPNSHSTYNGAELTLNISYNELKTYEEKNEDKGIVESVTETIKDKTKSLKGKTVDKLDDDDEEYQQQIKETRINQDIQTSTNTNTLNRENRNELNRNIDSGEKSDESSTNVASSFTCERCNTKFTSRQELKEHSSSQH